MPFHQRPLRADGGGISRAQSGIRSVCVQLPSLPIVGEVGFAIAGVKELRDAHVGDTITLAGKPAPLPLPGFQEAKPQVFAGLYPAEANQ